MNEKQNIVEEKNNESIEPQVVPEQNETLSEKGKKKGSFLKKGFTIMIFIILLIGGLILFYPKYKESMDQSSFSKKVNKIMKEALDYSNSEASKESKTFKSVGIDLKDDVIDAKNMKAGYIVVTEEGTVAFEMTDGKYCAKKDTNSEKITIKNLGKELCDGSDLVKKEEKEVEIEEDNPFRKTIINVFSTLQAKYDVNSNHYEGEEFDLTNGKISYEGKKLTAGYAVITPVGQIAFEMTDGEYCAIKELDNKKIKYRKKTDSEACDGSSLKGSLMNWSIPKDAKRNGDTYYLNCYQEEYNKRCGWSKEKESNTQISYTCVLADCEIYEYDAESELSLIREGNHNYIYNYKTREETILPFKDRANFISYRGKAYGFSVYNGSKHAVYSIENNKFLSEYVYYKPVIANEYKGEIVFINSDYDAKYPALSLMNRNTLEEIKKVDNLTSYNVYNDGNQKLIVGIAPFTDKDSPSYLLDNDLNRISGPYFWVKKNSDNTISLIGDKPNQFMVLNFAGETIYTSKSYEVIYAIFKDYVLVKDNNHLKLVSHKGEEVADFLKMDDEYEKVMTSESGWREFEGKYRIIVNIQNKVERDYRMTFCYNPTTGEKNCK